MPNSYPLDSASIQLSQNSNPFGSRTDVGYVREHNEDSMLVSPPLFVVCDGMGGHEAGEVASEIAVNTISRFAPDHLDADELGHAVEEANLAIIDAADKGIGRQGMGTTCTAAMLEDNKLAIAQVGDSRAYLLHNGSLQQLTRDHSVVAELVESGKITSTEARTHQWRSLITRALGLEPYMQPDLYELEVQHGDRLMLCSDGLYSMVPDSEIERILASTPDPQQASDLLVNAALQGGGSDNVTVIVADVTGFNMQKNRIRAKRSRITGVLIVIAMIAIIGLAVGSLAFAVNTVAYLADDNGKVAIYKGFPGDIFGIQTSSLYEVTDVDIDKINPGTASRIKELEIRCDTVDDAEKLVAEYRSQIAEGSSGAARAGSSNATHGNAGGSDASSAAASSSSSAQNSGSSARDMGSSKAANG